MISFPFLLKALSSFHKYGSCQVLPWLKPEQPRWPSPWGWHVRGPSCRHCAFTWISALNPQRTVYVPKMLFNLSKITELISHRFEPKAVWLLRLTEGPDFKLLRRTALWRRKWQPTPVFLPGKVHGQRRLVGCSPWGYMTEHVCTRAEGDGLVAIKW